MHVYGPAGIRNFIRTIFNMTESNSGDRYVAHELLRPGDATTSCAPDVLHMSEAPGRDIAAGEDGLWRGFLTARGTYGDIVVDAAPIAHRGVCQHRFFLLAFLPPFLFTPPPPTSRLPAWFRRFCRAECAA